MSSILIDKDHDSCDGSNCICVHGECGNKLEIWIHADTHDNRSIIVNRDDILSEKVIRFLNADAYDFIKEVEKKVGEL